jgi:hypothetical protein
MGSTNVKSKSKGALWTIGSTTEELPTEAAGMRDPIPKVQRDSVSLQPVLCIKELRDPIHDWTSGEYRPA